MSNKSEYECFVEAKFKQSPEQVKKLTDGQFHSTKEYLKELNELNEYKKKHRI